VPCADFTVVQVTGIMLLLEEFDEFEFFPHKIAEK
jgi:hypothetical protein